MKLKMRLNKQPFQFNCIDRPEELCGENEVIIAFDLVSIELFGYTEPFNDFDICENIHKEMNRRAILALKEGKDVIYICHQFSKRNREHLIKLIKSYDDLKNTYFECLVDGRDKYLKIMEKSHGTYECPSYKEGWNRIFD